MKVGFFGLLFLLGLGFAMGFSTHDSVSARVSQAHNALSARR